MKVFPWSRNEAPKEVPQGAGADPIALAPAALAARIAQGDAAGLRGDFEAARAIFAEINASNPGNSQVLLQLALCQIELGQTEPARESLALSIQADPKNARAMKKLAASMLESREFDAALEASLAVIALNAADGEAYVLAANANLRLGRYDETRRLLNLAWERSPDSPLVFYLFEVMAQDMEVRREVNETHPGIAAARRRVLNRLRMRLRKNALNAEELIFLIAILSGSEEHFPEAARLAVQSVSYQPMQSELATQIARVLHVLGDTQKQLDFARAMFELEPDNLARKFSLGSAWIAAGSDQWSAGWRLMTETYFVGRPFVHPQTVPIWEGQKVGKKKLLVYQDQGAGDAVLGFRFLRELTARKIRFDVWVHPDLADLAARLPGVEEVVRSPRVKNPDPKDVAFAVSFFGLISAMNLQFAEIRDPPVIRPAPEYALALRQRVAALPGPRIGLLFGGNPKRRDDWLRTLPIGQIRRLAAVEGVSWVNLMIDVRGERDQAVTLLNMLDPMADIKNFCATAALIEELDAVVAVDASVAHLAGCLGKPTWVLVPTQSDWRWQIGAQLSPWWPTARVLRSAAPGDWTSAMTSLVSELQQFVRDWSNSKAA